MKLFIEKTIPSVAILLLLAVSAGCDWRPIEAAPVGATPAVDVPIGPIPGAGEAPKGPDSPYGLEPVALQQGREFFVWYNCAGCHGGYGGGGMGPSLRDKAWRYGSSDAHIFSSIAQGRSMGMPAWGTRLPEDHIWKLVSYIQSLGTPREPNPPIVAQPKVSIPPRLQEDSS